MDEVDEFLAHYGVKGMKWGVRRATALAERSASGSESTPYRQARIDTKARKAAVKTTGKGSTRPKLMTSGVIKERSSNNPEYKVAKKKYDDAVFAAQTAKFAVATVGLIAAPHLLELAARAVETATDREHTVDSLHKVVYKEFEKSAYGQARREKGRQFVDNSNHRVVGPVSSAVARR